MLGASVTSLVAAPESVNRAVLVTEFFLVIVSSIVVVVVLPLAVIVTVIGLGVMVIALALAVCVTVTKSEW